MTRHLVEWDDGTVSVMEIVAPRGGAAGAGPGAPSAEDEIAKWPAEQRARIVAVQPLDPAGIPADRTFRNAWIRDGAAIVHHMDRARAIKRDTLRAERRPLLEALDIAQKRALVAGDHGAVTDIEAKLQALRDLTADPAITDARTPDELKAVRPAALEAAAAFLGPKARG